MCELQLSMTIKPKKKISKAQEKPTLPQLISTKKWRMSITGSYERNFPLDQSENQPPRKELNLLQPEEQFQILH